MTNKTCIKLRYKVTFKPIHFFDIKMNIRERNDGYLYFYVET